MPKPPKPPRHAPVVRNKAERLYLVSGDTRAVADELGLNPVTVRKWRTRFGWNEKRHALTAQTAAIVESQLSAVSSDAALLHIQRVEEVKSKLLDHLATFEPEKAIDHLNLALALEKLNSIGRVNCGLGESDSAGARNTFNFNLGSVKIPTKLGQVVELKSEATEETSG